MYFGGKNGDGVYQAIINNIPPHYRYIELCGGSGAIIHHKKPAKQNYLVEINADTIEKFAHRYGIETIVCQQNLFEFCDKNPWLFTPDTFVYIDPPYPMQSRKSQDQVYEFEMSDQDHKDLLWLAKSWRCMVAISTYKNDLYQLELKDWRLSTFTAQTRRGKVTEYLYMNYPEPTELHQYNFLGKNYIERQAIKRKVDGHVQKFKRLPVLQRNAILQAILSSTE